MANMANFLDFDSLLVPLGGEAGVGEDLRLDSSPFSFYYRVKDARSRARAAERALVMQGDEAAETPDWAPVLDLAPKVIAGKAKDLEIAAYLIEALVRAQGFAGLREGFQLARRLLQTFGKNAFPHPDEDGVETQLAPFIGLNGAGSEGTLIQPINNVPLTGRNSVGMFGVAAYRQAIDLARLADDQKAKRVAEGAVTLEMFQRAIGESDSEELRARLAEIDGCLDEYKQLTGVLDSLYGGEAPPSSSIQSALDACRETLVSTARERLADSLVSEPAATVSEAATNGAPQTARGGGGALNNRDDAFREIMRIAQYFRTAEPHSPISYALEQIVRWGRLPLPALMKELISDTSSVSQLFKLVGIPAENEQQPG